MERLFFVFAVFYVPSLAIPISFYTPPSFCNSSASLDSASKAAKLIGNFAVNFYKKITTPKDNIVFSPVSIGLALGFLEEGAVGLTQMELHMIFSSLGVNPNLSESFNESFPFLQCHLQKIQTEEDRWYPKELAKVYIANGFFVDEKLNLKESFLENVKDFGSELRKMPFRNDSEKARHKINQWVSDKTNGKISELFKENNIDSMTAAVLASSIYVKGPWEYPFEQVEDGWFNQFGDENKKIKVPFMVKRESDQLKYISKDFFHAVEMNYEGKLFSMFIIQPKFNSESNISSLENWLTGERLLSLFRETRYQRVTLKLPKFKIQKSIDLIPILQQMFVMTTFSDTADFSRMTDDDVTISSAVHEAYIKVNENGTEAAAATGVALKFINLVEPQLFVADHPFIFAIVHKPTSAIVFMGKVNSIEE